MTPRFNWRSIRNDQWWVCEEFSLLFHHHDTEPSSLTVLALSMCFSFLSPLQSHSLLLVPDPWKRLGVLLCWRCIIRVHIVNFKISHRTHFGEWASMDGAASEGESESPPESSSQYCPVAPRKHHQQRYQRFSRYAFLCRHGCRMPFGFLPRRHSNPFYISVLMKNLKMNLKDLPTTRLNF